MNLLIFHRLPFCTIQIILAEVIKGTVFNDTYRNSMLDRTERGISGVAVSNGRDITLTNNRGATNFQ